MLVEQNLYPAKRSDSIMPSFSQKRLLKVHKLLPLASLSFFYYHLTLSRDIHDILQSFGMFTEFYKTIKC